MGLAHSRYYRKIYQAFRIRPPYPRTCSLSSASPTVIYSVTLQGQQVRWHPIYIIFYSCIKRHREVQRPVQSHTATEARGWTQNLDNVTSSGWPPP